MKPVLLYNARFFDFVRPRRVFQAIEILNGQIHRLHKRKPREKQGVQSCDLKNKYVIPGFTDSHTHLIARGIELQRTDLENCRSLNDCLQKLNAAKKSSDVIFGSNWDESPWSGFQLSYLDRHTLDKIVRQRPLIMRRICGHFAVVNSAALRRIPHNWQIVDRKRGYLYEDAALYLNDIFQPDRFMLRRAVELGTREALSKGITSVHEISDPARLRLLQTFRQNQGLKIRWTIYILDKHLEDIVQAGLITNFGDNFLKFAGIKVFLDGSIGAKTAALYKPYQNTNIHGKILVSKRRLTHIIKTAEKNGLQLMIHAIGDRTSDYLLQLMVEHLTSKKNPLHHRIEHLEIMSSAAVRRLADLNLIASMQPNFTRKWQNPGGMYEHYLGSRYRVMNCFKKISQTGAKLIFGSDCMPLGPLFGLKGALDHPGQCGRLNRTQAFKAYTYTPAYATFEQHKKGRVSEGYFADLVVLDKDPRTEKDLDEISVSAVMVNGEFVYHNKSK